MSSDTPAVPRNRSVELQEVESSSSNENLSSMQNAHASTDALQALVTTCGEGEAVGDQKDFVARWWVDVLFVCCGVSVFARTEAFFMQTDLFVRRHAPGCALLRTLCVVFACVPVRVRACVRAYTGASVSFTLSLHAMLDSTKHVEKKTKEKNTPHDAMGCTQAHLHILLTPAGLLNWALACEYVMEKRCPLVKQKIKLITCTTMSACFEPFGPKAFGCVM